MNYETLIQFGLSENEAKIYIACLELGAAYVSSIAAKAGINRTTAYDILEYLVKKGLVGYVGAKKDKQFAPERPEALIEYLNNRKQNYDKKINDAKNILPELLGIYNAMPQKPKVKFYNGIEGIKTIYLDSLNTKGKILSWLDLENMELNPGSYFIDEYPKERTRRGIKIKAIVADCDLARKRAREDKKQNREMRIIPKNQMNIMPECYIYDNKVAFMSHKERFGVMIESKDIAEAQRKLYMLAWEKAKELES
jgi:sugar-specific transcriptional regulator TrmB